MDSLKVLLVPDMFSWILGTWAKQISLQSRRHQYYFFSVQMRAQYPAEFRQLLERADVVHVLTQHGMGHLAYPPDKALVGTIHHVVEWDELEPITQADGVCYVSSEWRDYLMQKGVTADRLFEIRNGVDTDFFKPLHGRQQARAELGINSDEFLVGFFGKYSSDHAGRKGIDIMVKTLDEIVRRGRRIGLLLTGPGWQPLVRALEATGVSTYYFPFLQNEQMPLAYNALNAYLISARIEGGPVPLLEAMACGLPVVTTPVGVVPEMVRDGDNGFVVPKESPTLAAERVLQLMDDAALAQQMGTNGRDTIENGWRWADTLTGIDDLYDRALAHQRDRVVTGKPGFQGKAWQNGSDVAVSTPDLLDDTPSTQQQAALLADGLIWHNKLYDEGNKEAALALSRQAWRHNPTELRATRRLLRLTGRDVKRQVRRGLQRNRIRNGYGDPPPIHHAENDVSGRAVDWINSMREDDDELFSFRMTTENRPTLYSQSFAILGLHLFDALAPVEPALRQKWAGQICRCYRPETGLFIDDLINPDDLPAQGHNWDYLSWQSTFFAQAALDALQEPYDARMPMLAPYRSPEQMRNWLAGRAWRNPWLESNNVMFITSFLIREWELTQARETKVVIDTVFDWLDENQNPITGYWDLGQGSNLLNAMAGAFHFYFLYFHLGRPVNFVERIIESTLSLQQPDGLYDPRGGGGSCLDLDAADILIKFSLLIDYKAGDIKRSLARTYQALRALQNEDGGFAEAKRPDLWPKSYKRQSLELLGLDQRLNRPWVGRPEEFIKYSGWDVMRHRIDASDQWSTWFRPLNFGLMSARYPGEFMDDVNWRFTASPTLGWHDRTKLNALREQYER